MTKKRGGYGHKMNVVKFRADETLNARLKEVARANQSAVARVVREMVVFALAQGYRGSEARTAKGQFSEV